MKMEQSNPPAAVGSNAGLSVMGAVWAAKFQRVPLADLTNPQKSGPLMVYQDHWWVVDDEDNVFFYKGKSYSPQCNINRLIVERHLVIGLVTRAVLVPWAWVKFDISDYA
jgi:hypothetical protein